MNSVITVGKDWTMIKDIDYLNSNPCDLVHLKELITGKIVVMGLHTWMNKGTIFTGKAAKIYVLSDRPVRAKSCIPVYSVEELLDELHYYTDESIFVVGGTETTHKLWEHLDTFYVTHLNNLMPSGEKFPNLDNVNYLEMVDKANRICGDIKFSFKTYKKAS